VLGVRFQWFTGTRRPGVFLRAFSSCLLLFWQIVPVRSSLCLFWISRLWLGSPGPNATDTNFRERTLVLFLCFFVLDACSWSPAFLFRLFFGECFLFWLEKSALRVLRIILVLLQLFFIWRVLYLYFLTLGVGSCCFADYFCFFLAVFRSESCSLSLSSFLYFLGLAFWDPSSSLIRICCRLLGRPTRTRLVRAC